MQKIWQQPFPSPSNNKHNLRMSLIAGICVFCVLYFIQPFRASSVSGGREVIPCIQYAVVTVLFSLLCNTAVPFLFPRFFKETRWTVLHEIIFLIVLVLVIALGNILFTTFKYNISLSGSFIFKMVSYTLAIGILPVIISVVINQQQLLMKYSKGAAAIEVLIAEKSKEEASAATPGTQSVTAAVGLPQMPVAEAAQTTVLHLTGTSQQQDLALAEPDFLFAEASDNYTAIHYLKNGVPQKALYRVTIKTLEAQAVDSASVFRCHKSYLVNLSKVGHISGNAQGYTLHLLQNMFEVPVSRSLNSRIKQEFAALTTPKQGF
jgi:DNA-binding LytR/AlgR family response regulator